MQRASSLMLWVLVATGGLTLRAADKPPADFVAAMKDAAAFVQEMSTPQAELDFARARQYVPVVRDAFAVVERYWLDRNQDGKYFNDIALSEEMIKLASDMGVAANLQSAEGVRWAVHTLAERCTVCHELRREKGPDGFLIKN